MWSSSILKYNRKIQSKILYSRRIVRKKLVLVKNARGWWWISKMCSLISSLPFQSTSYPPRGSIANERWKQESQEARKRRLFEGNFRACANYGGLARYRCNFILVEFVNLLIVTLVDQSERRNLCFFYWLVHQQSQIYFSLEVCERCLDWSKSCLIMDRIFERILQMHIA